MEPYNSECAPSRKILPVTEALANRILVLPTGAALDEGEVHQLCQLLRFVVTRGREIVARLSGQAQNAEKSRAA
jgi:dTDP-4-amino-4,6-dideoxygalactose transaminase